MHPVRTLASAMTPFPHSVTVESDLAASEAMMAEHQVHHLPVVGDGQLVGVLSLRDVHLAQAVAGPNAGALRVGDMAFRLPLVLDIHTPLGHAAREMAGVQTGAVLVTREGKLVGILTTTDVCRALGDLLDAPPPPDEVG